MTDSGSEIRRLVAHENDVEWEAVDAPGEFAIRRRRLGSAAGARELAAEGEGRAAEAPGGSGKIDSGDVEADPEADGLLARLAEGGDEGGVGGGDGLGLDRGVDDDHGTSSAGSLRVCGTARRE